MLLTIEEQSGSSATLRRRPCLRSLPVAFLAPPSWPRSPSPAPARSSQPASSPQWRCARRARRTAYHTRDPPISAGGWRLQDTGFRLGGPRLPVLRQLRLQRAEGRGIQAKVDGAVQSLADDQSP